MKILITNYTFDASAKTVTFDDYTTISLESVLLVTNVTDNINIYNFCDPLLGGTVATNVLTLTYDTTSMSDTDNLQIFYDDPVGNTPVNQFDEDSAVASTSETTVSTYIVGAGKTFNIEGFMVTGTASGRFKLKIDGTTKAILRTSTAERNAFIQFRKGVIQAIAAETVTVTSYHEETANQEMAVNLYGYLT